MQGCPNQFVTLTMNPETGIHLKKEPVHRLLFS